jgi:hypothetical protein
MHRDLSRGTLRELGGYPHTLGSLGFEIGNLVKKTALMLTIVKNPSDGCRNPRATISSHRQDSLGVQPPVDQLSEHGFPGYLALSVTLDEAQVFPASLLHVPYSAQGRFLADPLPAHLQVGSVNDEISKFLGDGPVQPPDQLPLAALVHPANLIRTHIAALEQMGDRPHLAGENSSEKHLRDDLVDPLVLPSVAAHNGAVLCSWFPRPGQTQILNEAEAGLEFLGSSWPRARNVSYRELL